MQVGYAIYDDWAAVADLLARRHLPAKLTSVGVLIDRDVEQTGLEAIFTRLDRLADDIPREYRVRPSERPFVFRLPPPDRLHSCPGLSIVLVDRATVGLAQDPEERLTFASDYAGRHGVLAVPIELVVPKKTPVKKTPARSFNVGNLARKVSV